MTRLVRLFLVVMILVAAIIAAIRLRTPPASAPEAPVDPNTLPIAPDMDSIPPDSLWFGRILDDRRSAEDFFRGPESPLEDRDRAAFQGLAHWPPDPAWRFRIRLERFANPDSIVLMDTKGQERVYEKTGRLHFTPPGGTPQTLTLFRQTYHNYFFLPFRDATSGSESYGMGRYVEPVDLGEDLFEVDFNRAYNPYCAYSPRFACPIPPEENRLTVGVTAGEMAYPGAAGDH
jgi:uncharacterized protein (DUF1684 family)